MNEPDEVERAVQHITYSNGRNQKHQCQSTKCSCYQRGQREVNPECGHHLANMTTDPIHGTRHCTACVGERRAHECGQRELRGLLEAAVCPMKEQGCDGKGYPVQVQANNADGWDYEQEQCQWCDERAAAIRRGEKC